MQGNMNRTHQLINGIADSGKANQRGERLKHVQHPQRGTYKTEQRTATIKQPTALQWAAMQGNTNRAHQLINGIAGSDKARTMNRAHQLKNRN